MSMADPNSGHRTDAEEAGIYAGRDLEAMSFAVNYHAWILDEFAPFLGKSGAEMGAGSGSFAEILAGAGLAQLVAFEPSPNMYGLLERRFRDHPFVKTRQAFLADAAPNYGENFDSVVYVNVLEHVENGARVSNRASAAPAASSPPPSPCRSCSARTPDRRRR